MFPKVPWRETQPELVASMACTSDIVLAWPFACLSFGAHQSGFLADHWRVVFPSESSRLVAPMSINSLSLSLSHTNALGSKMVDEYENGLAGAWEVQWAWVENGEGSNRRKGLVLFVWKTPSAISRLGCLGSHRQWRDCPPCSRWYLSQARSSHDIGVGWRRRERGKKNAYDGRLRTDWWACVSIVLQISSFLFSSFSLQSSRWQAGARGEVQRS
ncbi:hypothetical protein BDP55DRAFT_36170 [Colletotrichum godetiae]|uniref:Uncharacterized protein n=1 Tax=Colletotrichum godetiae TaxID=1209918 RepID=A0AAJ0EN48_9PEZI|nr:uncharacterized protein BDP55DRAFT_36170 [Colletotrichum godetiae]KAK1657197.1 hypothetical protein BDP55DRAFT_36170 [Colletotrichum godetiae]